MRWSIVCLSLCSILSAAMDRGPVHEAFVSPEEGFVLPEAVSKAPPEAKEEKIPEQTDAKTEWIEGYWAWVDNGYVWVNGVWRNPPPDREWISGEWVLHGNGEWVRVAGFWSDVAKDQLKMIAKTPPAPIQQSIQGAVAQDQFWVPGRWEYNPSSEEYTWYSGQWARQDANWVFVPGQYRWRPEGYIYVTGYWDYPLEHRGEAYGSAAEVLSSEDIVLRLLPTYPNYLSFFQHRYHFDHEWWARFWGTPPWWQSSDWWELTWQNQWALFWWWTHPGYPHPLWLTEVDAKKIHKPSSNLTSRMRGVQPPAIVMSGGVVTPNDILGKLKRGQTALPANGGIRPRVDSKLRPGEFRRMQKLEPTGQETGEVPARPEIAPPEKVKVGGKVSLPSKPQPAYGKVESDQPALQIVPAQPQPKPVQQTQSGGRPQWKDLPPEATQQLNRPRS